MKKNTGVILLVFIVVIASVVAISEKTAEPESARIGYVDMDSLFRSNSEWIEFNKGMQSDMDFYQKQLNTMSLEYNKMKESGTSELILKEKEQEIFSRKAAFEENLNNTYTTKYEIITRRINNHLKDFAAFNGYDLIITSSAIVYGTGAYDITEDLINYIENLRK